MKIRVLSYNIHRAIGVDRRFRLERIAEILRYHAVDIAFLQEVDEGAPRSRELHLARELAAAAGFHHVAMGHNVQLRKGRYGNATLSRFPIERERNIDLTIGKRKRRGCQHTSLLADAAAEGPRRLEVFNLHLGLSALERQRQVQLLLRSPEFRALPADTPCLLAGDFNDWRSLLAPIFTQVLDFHCASLRAGGRRAWRTFPSLSPRAPLDRIYCRGPIEVLDCQVSRLRLARVASDHLPLIAEFELR